MLPLAGSLLLMTLAGCNGYVADRIAAAQNLDLPIRGQDAQHDLLTEHHVSRQLRITVGPPTATLSVWIVEPLSGPGTVWIHRGKDNQYGVGMTLDPSTRPTTDTSLPQTQPSKSPKGTVFLLHGWGDQKESAPYEFYSFVLAASGYRVVLVDLRGHGRSTGDHLTFGAVESHDLTQVLDQLDRQGLIAGNVGVIGVSYGAATAICWAAIDRRVHAVVALEPFSSLHDAALDGGPILLHSVRWFSSDRDFLDIVKRVGRLGQFDPDKASPLVAIARTSTPVLLIHGTSDTFLHPAESVRLHQAAPNHSRLILVDGANHMDLCMVAVKMITTEANAWFDQYLDPPPTTEPTTTQPSDIAAAAQ